MKRILIILIICSLFSLNSMAEETLSLYKNKDNIFISLKVVYKNVNELKKKLSSGLSNKIVVSMKLKDKKSGKAIVEKSVIYEAVYDVWEEKYRLYSFEPLKTLVFETNSKDEVFDRFLNITEIKLCDLKSLSPDGTYNLKISVLVNPVSKEIVEKIKEYLSDPEAVQKGTPTRTIFGSFANAFIPELNVENSIKMEMKSFSLQEIEEKR